MEKKNQLTLGGESWGAKTDMFLFARVPIAGGILSRRRLLFPEELSPNVLKGLRALISAHVWLGLENKKYKLWAHWFVRSSLSIGRRCRADLARVTDLDLLSLGVGADWKAR